MAYIITKKTGNNSFQSVIKSQVLKQLFHMALYMDHSFLNYM